MNTEYVYVSVHDDQEEVAETFKKYGFLAIPVVDNEHRLVGIITFDDILDVIEEETTEDMKREWPASWMILTRNIWTWAYSVM